MTTMFLLMLDPMAYDAVVAVDSQNVADLLLAVVAVWVVLVVRYSTVAVGHSTMREKKRKVICFFLLKSTFLKCSWHFAASNIL